MLQSITPGPRIRKKRILLSSPPAATRPPVWHSPHPGFHDGAASSPSRVNLGFAQNHPGLRRGKPLTARPQPGNSFWGGGGNGMNELASCCPGWSGSRVVALLPAVCSRGLGSCSLPRAWFAQAKGWARRPARFAMVARRHAGFGSQATEREEGPGFRPGRGRFRGSVGQDFQR